MSNEINKFEQMLEKLTADDRAAAEALFHEIVVEKSRAIYSDLLETDLADVEVADAPADTTVDEAKKKSEKKEHDKEDAKADSKEDSKEMKKESSDTATAETTVAPAAEVAAPVAATTEVGGDATDDMLADIEDAKKSDDKEHSKEDKIEDKIEDLEDAVEELKAEFEKMMSDEGDKDSEEKEEAVEVQPSAEEIPVAQAPVTSELGAQPAAESKSDREQMREYVDKVAVKHADNTDNEKSPTPKQAKAMGGKAVDIVGSEEKGRPAPKAEKHDAGNVNVPGGHASKMVKAKGPETADKADNTTSVLGSK